MSTAPVGGPGIGEDRGAVAAGVLAHTCRLRWSADRIAAARQRALRELVAHATTHSPVHAARLGGPGPTADIVEPVREVLRATGLAEPEVIVELVDGRPPARGQAPSLRRPRTALTGDHARPITSIVGMSPS